MTTIIDFISELRTNATKSTYRAGIYAFFDWKHGRQRVERKASQEEVQRYENLAVQYLSDGNNYAEDLRKYAASMQDIPPKTAAIRMTGIKEYLLFNDIEFSEKNIRQIKSRMPKGGARTVEKDLDHEVLQTILAHADCKLRALILTLASSGMRIGETLQLRVTDINFDTVPAEVTIRQEITKTRQKRVTFLSKEAVAALKEWMKVRQAYLVSAKDRNAGFVRQGIGSVKSADDPRLFPFAGHVAQSAWRTALKNANLASLDEATNRSQLHYHQLRKFFRSQMALTCPVDIVEALMGHEGYLAAAYRRYTLKQMAEYYQKSETMITLHLPSKEITRVESEVKEEMKAQQMVIAQLSNKIQSFETLMATIAEHPEALQKASAARRKK